MENLYQPDFLYYKNEFHRDYAVVTENDTITEVGRAKELLQKYPKAQKIRWKGQIMLPGTVNVHQHSFQSLLRGIAADRPFLEWRDRSLYHFSPLMSKEDIYNGAIFAL